MALGEAQWLAQDGKPESAGKPGDSAGQKPAASPSGEARLSEGKPTAADAGLPASAFALPSEADHADGSFGGAAPRKTAVDGKNAPQMAQLAQGQVNEGEENASVHADASTRQAEADGRQPAAVSPTSSPKAEAAWIGPFLRWLGAGHENGMARRLSETRVPSEQAISATNVPAGDSGEDSHQETARTAGDSLKSGLLTLAANEETPPALREAAQSLVSQITGQQLLLSSERQPNAPYSLMTLFVPMKSRDGETTATVHVQTRRGRRGEWDTDNCRLLFDLRMRNLGDTVVDVQVTDRIVSVKLMNDFPGLAALANQAKQELTAGLQHAGFQLLSMTAVPLPAYKQPDTNESADVTGPPVQVKSSSYTAKKYKGVDYRV